MADLMEMWEMLDLYQLETNDPLTPGVKCVICNKLLTDAYHGPCGCNYCKKCITLQMKNGLDYCPGILNECRSKQLSFEGNLYSDFGANMRVSNVVVKCPFTSCTFRDKILAMSDHIRVFHSGLMLCPFNEIGCTIVTFQKDQLFDHLLTEIYQHSKLIVEWIINLRNEITSLTSNWPQEIIEEELINLEENIDLKISEAILTCESENVLKVDLSALQQELTEITMKNKEFTELIVEMKEEFSLMKKGKQDQSTDLSNVQRESTDKNLEIFQLRKDKLRLEKELSQMQKAIKLIPDLLQTRLTEKSETSKAKVQSERRMSLQQSMTKVKHGMMRKQSFDQIIFESEKSELQDNVGTIFSIKWVFLDVLKDKSRYKWIKSDMRYSGNQKYKMWLELNAGGCIGHIGTHVCIRFRIAANSINNQTIWPLNCVITMSVINRTRIDTKKTFKKPCKFDKPNSLSNGELFHVSYQDMEQFKLIDQNSIYIECYAEKN